MHNKYEEHLEDWVRDEKLALKLVALMNTLWIEKSIKLKMFRKTLLSKNTAQIIDIHNNSELDLNDTNLLANAISELDLTNTSIDIGYLTQQWSSEQVTDRNEKEFVNSKLKTIINNKKDLKIIPKDIVLYGLGRIGRLCARLLTENSGKSSQLRLRAIVTRSNSDNDILKRASLLQKDSVHGPFFGNIKIDLENKCLIINGQLVYMIAASDPSIVDFGQYEIKDALLIDNTGAWRDRNGLGQHLNANGISKVLLTAPGKEDIPNIVFGVNHERYDYSEENIFSAASCTTNAIVPILSLIEEKLKIEKGHIETVHAYTNDQNLLDNYHSKSRRGRSAALNMVLTETGAGKAVVKCISQLKDKLTANAVRVPTPNGSLVILNLTVTNSTNIEEVNNLIKEASVEGSLVDQIKYSTSEELVSSDIVGNVEASIFDSPSTIISKDGKSIVLYVWYDNEFGYTQQVIRLAKKISSVRLQSYCN